MNLECLARLFNRKRYCAALSFLSVLILVVGLGFNFLQFGGLEALVTPDTLQWNNSHQEPPTPNGESTWSEDYDIIDGNNNFAGLIRNRLDNRTYKTYLKVVSPSGTESCRNDFITSDTSENAWSGV